MRAAWEADGSTVSVLQMLGFSMLIVGLMLCFVGLGLLVAP
jgi:hypothetical protein